MRQHQDILPRKDIYFKTTHIIFFTWRIYHGPGSALWLVNPNPDLSAQYEIDSPLVQTCIIQTYETHMTTPNASYKFTMRQKIIMLASIQKNIYVPMTTTFSL